MFSWVNFTNDRNFFFENLAKKSELTIKKESSKTIFFDAQFEFWQISDFSGTSAEYFNFCAKKEKLFLKMLFDLQCRIFVEFQINSSYFCFQRKICAKTERWFVKMFFLILNSDFLSKFWKFLDKGRNRENNSWEQWLGNSPVFLRFKLLRKSNNKTILSTFIINGLIKIRIIMIRSRYFWRVPICLSFVVSFTFSNLKKNIAQKSEKIILNKARDFLSPLISSLAVIRMNR